ncbi:MAG: acetyltransferase [Chlamydiales bacterium]|nr:acetyltransferase [Chlamydiales bacterium]
MSLTSSQKGPMIIREFQSSDLEAILELFHDVVHTVGSKYYDIDELNAWLHR